MTVVLLGVTLVLLLVGFCGRADNLILPRSLMRWLYIAMVIVVAAIALVWLFSKQEMRKKRNPSRWRTISQETKRSSFRLIWHPPQPK